MTEEFLRLLSVWMTRKKELDDIRSDASKHDIGYFYSETIECEADAHKAVCSELENLIDARALAMIEYKGLLDRGEDE